MNRFERVELALKRTTQQPSGQPPTPLNPRWDSDCAGLKRREGTDVPVPGKYCPVLSRTDSLHGESVR